MPVHMRMRTQVHIAQDGDHVLADVAIDRNITQHRHRAAGGRALRGGVAENRDHILVGRAVIAGRAEYRDDRVPLGARRQQRIVANRDQIVGVMAKIPVPAESDLTSAVAAPIFRIVIVRI